MWKKIKGFIPWVLSIISTFFITKFFSRGKSSRDEHSRSAIEIGDEFERNNKLSNQADGKLNSINEKLGKAEARVESIENGFPDIENGLTGSTNYSERIEELNGENVDIIHELQKRYDEHNKEINSTE